MSLTANAAEEIRWEMQSAWGSDLHQAEAVRYFATKIDAISQGRIQFRFHEPDDLVPAYEIWRAVGTGVVDAGFTTAGYHFSEDPALAFFTGVPFGPEGLEYLAWMTYGGGDQLKEEVYAQRGIYPLNCYAHGAEVSGWFKQRVASADDLAGLKIRYFGFGAMVLEKLGASTRLVHGSELNSALESGELDGAEFGTPIIDLAHKFHKVAKFAYFPGWHQGGASINELVINLEAWNALSDTDRELIRTACQATLLWSIVRNEAMQPAAMDEMEKEGVTFVRWSDEDLAKFRAAWDEVAAELSAENELFKRVYESYQAFRDEFAVWRENAFIE